MKLKVKTGADLARWREARGWAQWRAALWAGVARMTWQKWELEKNAIPRPIRLRIAEIQWQEEVMGACRDVLLAIHEEGHHDLAAMIALLESGTPDPERLRSAAVIRRTTTGSEPSRPPE